MIHTARLAGVKKLPRPLSAPHKIPLWAWRFNAWLRNGKRGPKPHRARRVPAWFWAWHLWSLARAQGRGSKAWRRYRHELQEVAASHRVATSGQRVAAAARNLAHLYGTDMPYTETAARDDWLIAGKKPPKPPINTDCSGFATLCYWLCGLPDPNGLDYKWLGWTGTELDNAAKVGSVTTDVSRARPGDIIVIGPGSGLHEVVCLEAGSDPLVASHGDVGVHIQRLSVDPREPKRVCKVL